MKKAEKERERKEEFQELKDRNYLEEDNRRKADKQRQYCQIKGTVKGFVPFVRRRKNLF